MSRPLAPPRPRARAAALLRRLLAILFVLALAALPLPFAALGAALARRPERRTDAVVMLFRRGQRKRKAGSGRRLEVR
jgi:hypothetical protein